MGGGQAFVFFSVDPDTGQEVAIKVARPSAWSRDRMAREIKVQQKLEHPNILPILDHDPALGWYATSRGAAGLESRGPFPRAEWTRLRVGLMGVASAIGYAHELGYLHSDISSGNVLVFSAGWAVSDWGFVYEPPRKGAPRMTQHLERFGTPEFMAPEMVVDPKIAGTSADIYSIGRLATWGTGLERGESRADDDAAVSWWRQLIDSTTAWDPHDRWTMRDVET